LALLAVQIAAQKTLLLEKQLSQFLLVSRDRLQLDKIGADRYEGWWIRISILPVLPKELPQNANDLVPATELALEWDRFCSRSPSHVLCSGPLVAYEKSYDTEFVVGLLVFVVAVLVTSCIVLIC
jgi:hypothetical protein